MTPLRAGLAPLALALLITACSDEPDRRRRDLGDSPGFADLMRVADPGRGERLFGPCAACHTVRLGAGDRNGPGLYDVVGRPPAENSRRFGYTAALRSLGGLWTPERLDAWLAAPATMVPGTSMGFRGVADPLDRADIIAYLQRQSVGGGERSPRPVPARPRRRTSPQRRRTTRLTVRRGSAPHWYL